MNDSTSRPEAEESPINEAVHAAESGRRVAWALFLMAIAFAVYAAADLILSIVVAGLFALLLAPAVKLLHRIKLPQPIAAAIVMVSVLALLGVLASNLYSPIRQWATIGPGELRLMERKVRALVKPVQSVKEVADKMAEIANNGGDTNKPREVVVERQASTSFIADLQEAIVTVVTTIMLAYFLLASGDTFLRKAVRVIPRMRDKIRAVEIAREIQQQIGRYFVTMTMLSAGLGVATWLAMWYLGMPTPLLWGAIAGVLNFIPYLGPIMAAMVIGVVSLITFDEAAQILTPVGVFVALHFIEGHLVEPIVMGGRFEMNPVVIFIWVLLWGWLGGAIGVLIAVPLLVALRICASHIPAMTPVAEVIARE